MGITKSDCIFLSYAKNLGVCYDQTVMLGRQELFAKKQDIKIINKKYNNHVLDIDSVQFNDKFSEPFFKILGAKKVDSIDFSDYENASIIHDLNNPISPNLKSSFSCVIDSGTMEHIFNFPVVILNCMQMLKIGGHFVSITPTNNQMGHGFYQFSPELFFGVLSEKNGFKINKMFVTILGSESWYEVANPKEVENRIEIINCKPTMIMLIAEKISEIDFLIFPQQTDYIKTWTYHNEILQNKSDSKMGKVKLFYRKLIPTRIRTIIRNLYNFFTTVKVENEDLGSINNKYFKKVDL